ncbi:MAG: DeoR/GlpR transcriptional regulator [Lentisphaeria bacterium]|nr:DeoR/GlpR transcriptional regulator [Lentisphaeria bacterium]
MNRSRREERICLLLEKRDFLSTGEIAALLETSDATARRVVNRLADNRIVRRVHGGIRRLEPERNQSIPFSLREQWFSREKRLIAEKAVELLARDSVVFIHGGSTTAWLGSLIDTGSIITNSLRLAELIRERFPADEGPEVIVPGGTLDRKAGILTGTRAERAIASYHADAVLFSARGIDAEGVLDTNDATAGVARAMIEHARLVVMLADHSKFRPAGMSRMVHWGVVDVLVTGDCPENGPMLDLIRQQGVKIIPVPCEERKSC